MTAVATQIVTDNRCIDVVPVLAVCKPDWHLAKKWLRWAAHLQRLEELVLLTSSDLTVAQVYELQQLAYRVATDVRIHHPNGFEEVGYFGGANQMFISALTFCEEFFSERAMLWLEADTCPMCKNWFDEIQREWRLCERPFLGDVVLDNDLQHMTGNAVYHPAWRKHAPSLAELPGPVIAQGWDSQCAHETFPQCARSRTILQRWRPPAITEEWFKANVTTDCTLFHQCKDGTMIDLLTDRAQVPRIPLGRPLSASTYPAATLATPSKGALPRVSCLIVTCARDVDFLAACLRSIRDHASGFAGVKVVVPLHERGKFNWIKAKDAQVIHFDEPPGKGMLAHEVRKCRADEICSDADFVLHLDADCQFFRHVTPADYVDSSWRALSIFEPYTKVTNPNRHIWRACVKAATGIYPDSDFMLRHPQIHPRAAYGLARAAVEAHTKRGFDEYVLSGRNEFPQEFCEFNTISAVGHRMMPGAYNFVEYDKAADAKLCGMPADSFQYCYRRDRDFCVEWWSHGGYAKYRADAEGVIAGRIPAFWVK